MFCKHKYKKCLMESKLQESFTKTKLQERLCPKRSVNNPDAGETQEEEECKKTLIAVKVN